MSKEAMKLALEALFTYEDDWADDGLGGVHHNVLYEKNKVFKAITALREAMAEQPAQHRSTGWAAHRDQYAVPVLFNPYTGEPRDVRDVQSDPQGILIVPPGKVEMLGAKPTCKSTLQVEQPAQQEPLTDDFLRQSDYHLLHRFIETTEDDEGYDIGKEAVKRLAELGVVQSHGFGKYSVTMFGYWVHERYWEQNPSLPLKTNADRAIEAKLKENNT